MTDDEYVSIMKEVMQKHPFLNVNGTLPYEPHKCGEETTQNDRSDLLSIYHKPAFLACLVFFQEVTQTIKKRHPKAPNSYNLKHRIEEACPEISDIFEGIFIAAGYHLNFRYSRANTSQRNFWIEKNSYNDFIARNGLNSRHYM